MGFNLDKARNKVLAAELRYAGDLVNFEFYPGKLGRDWQEKFDNAQQSTDSDKGVRGMIGALVEVLVDWDIETDLDALYREAYPDPEEREQKTGNREMGRGSIPIDPDIIYAADLPIPIYGVFVNRMMQESTDQTKTAKKG